MKNDHSMKSRKHQARVRQVRRIKIAMAAGGAAVIFFSAIGIRSCAARRSRNQTDSGATESALASSAQAVSSSSAEGSGVTADLTISAAGDCTLGTDENFDPSTSFDAVYQEKGDPSYFFANVRDIFASDDLSIVNLEGTLTEATQRADKTYAFKGNPEYTQILTDGSIEAVNLANNHSHDYGDQSYEDTINYVEKAGITSFGYNRSQIVTVKGAKVGLVGTYELKDGIGCKDGMIEQIQSVKEQGADLVIASFHWGTERENYPDDVQKELAHAAIDAGADLVLGHHPHVLQGIETYHGKQIVYSLGNFCFGGNNNPSDKDTMIYQQTFHINNGTVSSDPYETIPCSISSTSDYNDYQPTVLTGSEKERVQERIDKYSEGLSDSQ
jgi:poly-gamma-glutamate capsule biosynthesis protein CapA/YwtB (metallophosphatase superfamily)